MAFLILPSVSYANQNSMQLKPVEAKYVCMVNNKVFDTEQIAVEIEGKTYYGCCMMCKAKLQRSTQLRHAKDPLSGVEVNKADAVIGVMPDGRVHYFENAENMTSFNHQAMPEEHSH